jgi:hypothetical protein
MLNDDLKYERMNIIVKTINTIKEKISSRLYIVMSAIRRMFNSKLSFTPILIYKANSAPNQTSESSSVGISLDS